MDNERLIAAICRPLVWHHYDVWTWWAECPSGTYHVEERNGGWRVQLRVGGLVHDVQATEDTTPEDLAAAQAAAEADYRARIAAALDLDKIGRLVNVERAMRTRWSDHMTMAARLFEMDNEGSQQSSIVESAKASEALACADLLAAALAELEGAK